MKNLLSIILSALLFSCNGADDFPPEPNKQMNLNIENDSIIQLWCNSIFSFDAFPSGIYHIKSKDESICSVTNESSHFTLRTHKPGKTLITISDGHNEKTVTLNSIGFSGTWKESQELSLLYRNYIGIVAPKGSVYDAIEHDLKSIYLNRGIEYTFLEENNKLYVLIPANGDPVEGTYNFDIESQVLNLNYGTISESYYCDIQPIMNTFNKTKTHDRFVIALHQDLTEKYKKKYPNYNIEKIYIIRHIMSLGSWWIAKKIS